MVEVKDRPKTRNERTDAMAHTIRKIGVVGAGQMGNGIAHVCALPVSTSCSTTSRRPDHGGACDDQRQSGAPSQRQRIRDEERQAAIKRISPAKTLDDLADCDLVIEAATEKEELKRKSLARCVRR